MILLPVKMFLRPSLLGQFRLLSSLILVMASFYPFALLLKLLWNVSSLFYPLTFITSMQLLKTMTSPLRLPFAR